MRLPRLLLILAFALFLAAAAGAEEIVYLTNGTALPVVRHHFKDGMIHVDLGNDSRMAFPQSLVERIERTDGKVVTSGFTANQRVGGGFNTVPSVPDVVIDDTPYSVTTAQDQKTGLSTYRPKGGAAGRNKRGIQVVGNRAGYSAPLRPGRAEKGGAGGYTGTTPMGGSHIIGIKGVSPRRQKRMTGPVMPAAAIEAGVPRDQGAGGSKSEED